ncbi:hypothetical protein TNCV_58451 [Trichonephila clavipes]|nr:hypothetical protein TNCV_58451 [Trichonephila clavipes]
MQAYQHLYCVIEVPDVTFWNGVTCLLFLFCKKLEPSVRAMNDAGIVFQCYTRRSQLETDLVISQTKQCFWNNHESAPAFKGNFSLTVSPGVSPVYLDRCVTVVPTAARISAADAKRGTTDGARIRRSSFLVVPRFLQEPGLLEAVPYFDHCSQQSRTVGNGFYVFLKAYLANIMPDRSS